MAADRDVVDTKGGSATASAPLSGAVAPSGDGYVTTEQQEQLKSDLETLSIGESLIIPGSQGSVLVTKTSAGLALGVLGVTENSGSTVDSFCGVALATAIVGIGAGALGVLAAMTGGGTAVIAGFVLTGGQIGVLAGISGSCAAVLG